MHPLLINRLTADNIPESANACSPHNGRKGAG
jgi:hypothetical protein